MAADPWDVFGSDSDDDPSAATPVPTPITAATHLPAAKRKQKRYGWEALLPVFRYPPGLDVEGGDGGSLEGQEADGGSTSVAAAATMAAGAAGAPARAPFSAPPVYQHPSVRYEPCMPHRGGGRGFMASADIAPGTLLLVERRFLPMPTAVECGLAGGVGQTAKDMLGHLEKRSAGVDTKTSFGVDVRGIVRLFGALQSNGFASGVYLHPAMTNHSCRPNAIKWRAGQSISDRKPQRRKRQERSDDDDGGGGEGGESLLSEIRATEVIRQGEEITISYLEPREIALESRQSRLKDQFGFHCNCSLCEDSSTLTTTTTTTTTSGSGTGTGGAKPSAAELEGFLTRPRGDADAPDQPPAPVAAEASDKNTHAEHETGAGLSRGPEEGAESEGGAFELPDEHGERQGNEGGEGDDEEEDRGGLVARNVLERRLEAAESVVDLSRAREVRWAGVLSEVLGYRGQAAQWLAARHISLARADKLIAKACVAILQGSTEAARLDAECAESVQQASDQLPSSFGGCRGGGDTPPPPPLLEGSFKTRLLAVFLSALISRRTTQLLYLGDGPHPEAGACLADLSQAMGMLLAQGSEGQMWIDRLPIFGDKVPSPIGAATEGEPGEEVVWLGGGGVSGASLFERECDKAAKRIGGLFDAPQ
eukprot:g9019.t1